MGPGLLISITLLHPAAVQEMDTGALTQRHVTHHPGHVSPLPRTPARDCQEMRLRLQWRNCCRSIDSIYSIDTIDIIDTIDSIDRSEISCGGIHVTMAGCHHTVCTVSPILDTNMVMVQNWGQQLSIIVRIWHLAYTAYSHGNPAVLRMFLLSTTISAVNNIYRDIQ